MSKLTSLTATVIVGMVWTRCVVAQSVSGIVVLPNDTPAAGVIVTALDDRGSAIARALASADGGFSLRLPRPGRVTLQLMRIGYSPTRGPTLEVTSQVIQSVRLVFANRPVVLSGVDITTRQTCRVSTDTGLMVTHVWEEAKKAMLATQLRVDAAPLIADWLIYDRALDSTSRTVREQRVRTARNETTHAFTSEPAGALETKGYVISDGDSSIFLAPDVDVLLSDIFAQRHCFHLAERPNAGKLIGVTFEPADERPGAANIKGTLWLDAVTNELRTLEFVYTNLPPAAIAARAGGEVQFLRLDDGNWLITRWSLRMPEFGARRAPTFSGRIVVSGTQTVLRGMRETGGSVTRLSRRDGIVYQIFGPEIALQLLDRDTLVRASDAILTLDGTNYVGKASASGRVELSPVMPGRYHARIRTAIMDSLGMPPMELDLVPRADAPDDTIWLPAARGSLWIQVRDDSDNPLAKTRLEIESSQGVERRSAITSVDGKATIRDLAPGAAVLYARRIGYHAGQIPLAIAPGRSAVSIVLSQSSPPELDTVRVTAQSLPMRLQDFESRRLNHQATVSITRADIRRRNPAQTWQMLTNVPSIRVVDNDTMVIVRSTRATITNLLSNDYCWTLVAVDGVVLNRTPGQKSFDLRQLPSPDEVYGIEVFAGAASIPLQYGGEGEGKWCGLIAIWTR